MNPVPFLVLVGLALVAFRFYQPWTARPEGVVVRRFRVPLMARVRLQRPNVYALAGLMILGGAGGWLPPGVQLLIAGATVVLLFIPVRYTLTDQGIALGRTRMRRWSEFEDVECIGGRLLLVPVEGEAAFEVWLPASGEADAIEKQVSMLLGATRQQTSPPSAATPHPEGTRFPAARPTAGRGKSSGRRGAQRGLAKRAV
jgi:hypothetical protein